MMISRAFLLGLVFPVNVFAQTFRATPDIRIGSVDDPDYSLTWILNAVLDVDNNLYVLFPSEQTVRVFDPKGKLLRKIGRKGNGPGELASPAGMGWKGDTLWIFDSVQARLSLYNRDGSFVRSVSPRLRSGAKPGEVSVFPEALLPDGDLAGRGRKGNVRDPNDTDVLFRVSESGDVKGTLAVYRVGHQTLILSDKSNPKGTTQYSYQPFSDATLMIPDYSRQTIWIIERPIPTREAVFRVYKINLAGDTVLRRTFTSKPVPISRATTQNVVDRLVEGTMRRATSSMGPVFGTRATAEKIVKDSLFRPRFHPAVSSAIAGSDGTLWVSREDTRGETLTWNVFDTNLRPIGTTVLSRKARAVAANRAGIWLQEADELDVTYVVHYRLHK